MGLRSPFLRHSWIIAVASSSEDSAVLSTWDAVSNSKHEYLRTSTSSEDSEALSTESVARGDIGEI